MRTVNERGAGKDSHAELFTIDTVGSAGSQPLAYLTVNCPGGGWQLGRADAPGLFAEFGDLLVGRLR